ncbi:MAG TPA: ATP-grasp domain-containing protein [Geobacteraceae bacterium]|nr:ATP-grasp domain-containing protein [Geobacteraceae bacterium]
MFFVEKPYVSDFLKRTLRDHAIPVVGTPAAAQLNLLPGTTIVSEEHASRMIADGACPSVYTTSENALGWIFQNAEHQFSRKIELFKNKFAFRTLTRPLFPNFFFAEVRADELATFPFHTVSCPCIIKPSVGFFSMGVSKVSHEREWPETVASIFNEIERTQHLYPTEVFNPRTFIIEQCITGDEFAVDAYYTAKGEPVILGIFHHYFSSEKDVSDRVYTSSKAIIEQHLEEFTEFVGEIGRLADARNFPMHIELRKSHDGTLLPIEVNPLRFGGWCTTADITSLAYGLNPYLAFYRQERPDWSDLLKGKDGKLFSVVVLDNSTGVAADEIAAFQYEKVLSLFEKPLELRKIDYHSYPVFGFVFTETREERQEELRTVLHSTLREFVAVQ